ncbi:hypothetical protein TNCV_3341011 [Trichonephila clavipes]|nr:hypothetical protein TNCV_3341011 [Trichonephila clavipes]
MAAVDFLHHKNPQIWAGIKPTTLGAEGTMTKSSREKQTATSLKMKMELLKAVNQKSEKKAEIYGRWHDSNSHMPRSLRLTKVLFPVQDEAPRKQHQGFRRGNTVLLVRRSRKGVHENYVV